MVSLAVLAWLGWQKHTFLDPDTWYVQGPKLWWPLCVSEPVQMHAFLIHCSLVIFLLCFPHASVLFLRGCDDRTYISRCWDLIVQGPDFDELDACLSLCTFIHSELGLNYVFLVYLWSNDANGCLFLKATPIELSNLSPYSSKWGALIQIQGPYFSSHFNQTLVYLSISCLPLFIDIIHTGGPKGWPGYATAYPKTALFTLMTSLT